MKRVEGGGVGLYTSYLIPRKDFLVETVVSTQLWLSEQWQVPVPLFIAE